MRKRDRDSRGRLAVLLAILGVAAGCAYGFSSSLLPGHIKTIAIPLMENETNRGDLSSALADSLVEAFIDNHTLRVTVEKEADSVLEGVIREYRREPYTVDENETVQQYRVEIVVEVSFLDVRKNKVIWEDPRLSQWDTYNFVAVGGQPAESEEIGIGRVLAKLTNDIVNRTVEGW
jgi:hypothetical protein